MAKTFLRITSNNKKIVDSHKWQDRYQAMLVEVLHLEYLAVDAEMYGVAKELSELARKIRHIQSGGDSGY